MAACGAVGRGFESLWARSYLGFEPRALPDSYFSIWQCYLSIVQEQKGMQSEIHRAVYLGMTGQVKSVGEIELAFVLILRILKQEVSSNP